MRGRMERMERGVTLTELLVVISIMIILMAIMASALGAFKHTSAVDASAHTLATAFREAKFYALNRNVPVMPIILRDQENRFTCVYAAKGLHFRGTLTSGQDAPVVWAPAEATKSSNPWTLTARGPDRERLQEGAFVYLVGNVTLDLNNLGAAQAYYEMTQMRVKPPANKADLNDASKYTYEMLARGVHNTARGTFTKDTTSLNGVDGYVVVSGSNTSESISKDEARDYTLSGYSLEEHVFVDQVPSAEDEKNKGPVQATIIAQAAMFQEEGSLLPSGGKQIPSNYFPIFLPIFLPDGRMETLVASDYLGSLETKHYKSETGWIDRTVRVVDEVSREVRFVTIHGNGMVSTGAKVPTGYGRPDGDAGIPGYMTVYDPTSTSASSATSSSSSSTSTSTASNSSATSSNSSSTTTGSTSTSSNSASTASTSSSTGTGSTTASSSASTSSASSSASTSASSTNSASTSANSASTSSAASSSSSSSSTSASSSSSTGTGSTTASSSSSASSASSSSASSASAASTTGASTSASTSASSTASTSGVVSSSGGASGTGSSGGTSTGGTVY